MTPFNNKKHAAHTLTSTGHRIGAYIRVSTEEQAENPEGSIKNQEERIKDAVRYKSQDGRFGEIVATYIDRARSGKDTNRPELQRLLSAIRRKEVTLVMVTELSRLSRSIKDFAEMWEMMQAHGCGFLSLRENFDTTTAAGEMVLYSLANIAQYERRQVSERVTANMNARAARGLYNGGPIPLGYELDPDQRGRLRVEPEQALIVLAAFQAFIDQGSLSPAAKWLNERSYHAKRQVQGGGSRPRLGSFTVDNLQMMLRQRAYLGVRSYRERGELKEVEANWAPIIDRVRFERVQAMLDQNRRRYKPKSEGRYPYTLSGLTSCAGCGYAMVGKSAHGNGGKIGYYEHSWATKQKSTLVKVVFNCKPCRVLAKQLEPAVWEEVMKLLQRPEVGMGILAQAQSLHAKKRKSGERERIEGKVTALQSQLEALAERLAQLPKNIPASLIYQQMEKLQTLKTAEEEKIRGLGDQPGVGDLPAELGSYQRLLDHLQRLTQGADNAEIRSKIIQKLIHKVEVKPEGFRLHYFTSQEHVERELAMRAGSRPFTATNGDKTASINPAAAESRRSRGAAKFSLISGSNTLTNGAGKRT